MTKQEFVDGLATALNVTGNAGLINENRQFYNEYIDGEIAKGRTEAEVMEELGDPRLIAKSIMDAGGYSDDLYEASAASAGNGTGSANAGGGKANAGGAGQQTQDTPNKVAKVLKTIIIILVVIGILYLIIKASVGILTFLAPVLIPVLIIWLIVSLLRRR